MLVTAFDERTKILWCIKVNFSVTPCINLTKIYGECYTKIIFNLNTG